MGYKLVEQRPWGAVELIEIANRRLYGASDPRQPAGAAVGYRVCHLCVKALLISRNPAARVTGVVRRFKIR